MKNKLIITRITAYSLSSGIMLPTLYKNLDPLLSVFIIGVYLSIFFITRYYAKNNTYKPLDIFTESILTTVGSFVCGMLAISILIWYLDGFYSWFMVVLIGCICSIFIGIALFIINGIIITTLQITSRL